MFTKDNLSASFRYYPDNHITVCTLTIDDVETRHRCDGNILRIQNISHVGIARLKPGEQPNQLEAGEVSLGRALDSAGFSKQYRKDFLSAWKQDYLSHHPVKPVTEPVAEPHIHIPDGWYKLSPDDTVQNGDSLCYLNSSGKTQSFELGSSYYGETVKSINSLNSAKNDYVIRRLPTDAKLIEGMWMRKLGPDEILQKGDWLDYHHGYPRGYYINGLAGEQVKDILSDGIYRPLTKKGNTKEW